MVRDSSGQTIGNLAVDDFQLFDNGKTQSISRFTVETLGQEETAPAPAANASSPAPSVPAPSADDTPDHFIAWLFDDLHLSLQDLVATRNAALRQIDSTQAPKLRVAIYTTSGRQNQEFTADHDKIHAASKRDLRGLFLRRQIRGAELLPRSELLHGRFDSQ